MSEVKILWKTTCRLKNTEHLAKKKIRPKNTSSNKNLIRFLSKKEDAVKIRFGQKWYDGEILESWNPEWKAKDN